MDGLAVGIDVGGTKILACVIDEAGTVVMHDSEASPADPSGLSDPVGALVDRLFRQLGDAASSVQGLGIALPGLVDQSGILHAAPNLGAAETTFEARTSLADALQPFTSITTNAVAVDNDSTCAAIAEAHTGAAVGARDAIVISLGTGIGAGLVQNGAVTRGGRHFAGEIGHMIVDPNGPICNCGRRGCWETLASGQALGRLGRQALQRDKASSLIDRFATQPSTLRGEDIVAAAREGDDVALSVLADYAHFVALGLSNILELLDPELIVIGGGLVLALDVLIDPIRTAFESLNRPAQARMSGRIVPASLGDRAAAIGAGLIGFGLYS